MFELNSLAIRFISLDADDSLVEVGVFNRALPGVQLCLDAANVCPSCVD